VIEASVLRSRPFVLTPGAMVLGAVPLALARGAGAESRAQIGWVIVGGMTLGTLLTLFVLPSVIVAFDRFRKKDGYATGHA
ncbi:MAG: efflux RND transporter permease subunit, partial [Burkholderiaceae bacterium]